MRRFSLYRQNDVFQGVGGAVRGLQSTSVQSASAANLVEGSSEVSAVDEVGACASTPAPPNVQARCSGCWGSG
jgi:hypothetical protein